MHKPQCPVFGLCGGCAWQDIPYEEQVNRKKEHLSELLKTTDFSVITGSRVLLQEPYGSKFHS